MKNAIRRPIFMVACIAAAAIIVAVHEWPYINWKQVSGPVDQRPLVIRQDAKGDGRFNSRRSGNRRHRGIDLAAPLNSPVRAIRSGKALEVGSHKGLGLFVRLQHSGNLQTLYAHLNAVHIKGGERIRQGQVIGTIGKTGNAKHPWIAPHVHLEVVRSGTPIDPAQIGLAASDAGAVVAKDADAQDESSETLGGE